MFSPPLAAAQKASAQVFHTLFHKKVLFVLWNPHTHVLVGERLRACICGVSDPPQMSRRATSPAARRGAAVGTPNKEPRTPKEKAPLVWGEYAPHAHLSGKNILNAILCVVVLVPSYTLVFHLYTSCPNNRAPSSSTLRSNIESLLFSPVVGDAPGGWCDLAMNHPVSFGQCSLLHQCHVASG